MNYQYAIDRAITLRLRAKKESDSKKREALLALALEWEAWAEGCRVFTAKGEPPPKSSMPPEDI